MIKDCVSRLILELACAIGLLGIMACTSPSNNVPADTRSAQNAEVERLRQELAKSEAERETLARRLEAGTQQAGIASTDPALPDSSRLSQSVTATDPTTAPGPTAAAAQPVDFALAVQRTLDRLIADVEKSASIGPAQPRSVIIDPLIDGNTGIRTVATESMGIAIARRLAARYPELTVKPFERASLKDKPLLLVGTLTAVSAANDPKARNDVFRICLALIDLGTGRVVGRAWGGATEQSVNAMPVAFYADAPAWDREAATEDYIRTCQEISVRMPADPKYLDLLPVSMLINEALIAYNNQRYQEASSLYRSALSMAGGDQLRVIMGLYLANWKLRRTDEAAQAFDQLVGRGLKEKKLTLKILFQPNSVAFIANRDLRTQYALWLHTLARRAAAFDNCLRVVGHTSRSGSDAVNMALSTRRAGAVRDQLAMEAPKLANRMAVLGVGSREAIVGLGTDDARDAIDRRVEFKVVECPA